MDNRCGTVPPYCSSLTNPILTAPPRDSLTSPSHTAPLTSPSPRPPTPLWPCTHCSLPKSPTPIGSLCIVQPHYHRTPPLPRLRTRRRWPSRPSPPSRGIWFNCISDISRMVPTVSKPSEAPSTGRRAIPLFGACAVYSRLIATICHNPVTYSPTENIPNIKIYVVFA